MSLSIIHFPHPTLRHRSKPLKRVDAELRKMVAEMFDLMYEHEGIGLAANQVDLPYRLFVINPTGDPDEPEAEQVFINPVLSGGKGQEAGREGCLSLPGVYAPVVRNTSIKVQAYDLSGNEISGELTGMDARVVQHETDHLDGVMFIDRLTPAVQADIAGAVQEFEIEFSSRQQSGEAPSDEDVAKRIADLETLRT
ncbi:MAG: peptide deformylase [Planctomycetota bacterium]